MKKGDYIRTIDGFIAKYKGYNEEYHTYNFDNKVQWFYEYYRDDIDEEDWEEFVKENIVKTSPNLIDLIELGDYVNRDRVILAQNYAITRTGRCLIQTENEDIYDDEPDKIKSIVTKEQFERMEYEVR